MAFSAVWELGGSPNDPYKSEPDLFIEGPARKYVVDQGDGSTRTVVPITDYDGDGIKEGSTGEHQYSQDGTYMVTVTPGLHGVARPLWQVIVARGSTTDQALSGSGTYDFVYGGKGNDTIHGLGGDDVLLGGEGNDRLVGGSDAAHRSDNDTLLGGFGNDTLVGGAGDDILEGDNGVDRLIGGEGADVFKFARPRNAEGSSWLGIDPDRDVVLDFQKGSDVLDFSEWRALGRRPLAFIGEEHFHSVKNRGEIRVVFDNDGNTILQGDYHGYGNVDFSLISRELRLS